MIKARTNSSQIFIDEMEPTKNKRMTLDEAIQHHHQQAKSQKKMAEYYNRTKQSENDEYRKGMCNHCLECAKEYEQVAAWLKELKDYREGMRTCENCKHEHKAETEYPCSICRCNHPNKFEPRGGEDS